MSAREPAPARRRAAATIMAKLQQDLRHYRWFRPLSCLRTIPRFSNPRTYQGNAQCNRMRPAGEILSADCATPSLYQHNPSDFEQCRQVLNSREAIMPPRPSSIRRLLNYWDGPRGCKLERMARHERGACPSRRGGITSEKHNQTPQPAAARRVVPLFALGGV